MRTLAVVLASVLAMTMVACSTDDGACARPKDEQLKYKAFKSRFDSVKIAIAAVMPINKPAPPPPARFGGGADDDGDGDGDGGTSGCGIHCGGNSPIGNRFPFNGFGPEGQCNREGVRVVPGSMSGGKNGKCDGAILGVEFDLFSAPNNDGYKLIGKRGDQIACEGDELEHASFIAEGVNGWPLRYEIAKVVHVAREGTSGPLTAVTSSYVDPFLVFEGYEITSPNGASCNDNITNVDRAMLGLHPREASTKLPNWTPPASESGNQVIAVKGPLYNKHMDELAGTDDMFHLACTQDGVAKRSIRNLYQPDDQRNTGALKMVTATYCDRQYTVGGVDMLFYDHHVSDQERQSKQSGVRATTESYWASFGIVCMKHPRILEQIDDDNHPIGAMDLPDKLQPTGCTTDFIQAAVRRVYTAPGFKLTPLPLCDNAQWIDAVRLECGLPSYALDDDCTSGIGFLYGPTYGGESETVTSRSVAK